MGREKCKSNYQPLVTEKARQFCNQENCLEKVTIANLYLIPLLVDVTSYSKGKSLVPICSLGKINYHLSPRQYFTSKEHYPKMYSILLTYYFNFINSQNLHSHVSRNLLMQRLLVTGDRPYHCVYYNPS